MGSVTRRPAEFPLALPFGGGLIPAGPAYDAIRNGFHPNQQAWCVTDNGGTQHFFPDMQPKAERDTLPEQE